MTNPEDGKSKRRPRKRYDPALQQRALDLLNTSGLSQKKVALTVGVSVGVLRRWKDEQDEKIRCEESYKEELAGTDGWKYKLTERLLSGHCATTPPHPDWLEVGNNFVIATRFAMWFISMVVLSMGPLAIVSPFVLPTGHNESFGNWAWLVTIIKTSITFAAIAFGIAMVMRFLDRKSDILLGVIGVTVIPLIYVLIGSEGVFGGFIAVIAAINLVILAIALTIAAVAAIRMIFQKFVISYEFNADMGTFKCTRESLFGRRIEHAIPFSSLSSIQIHLHEQYKHNDPCGKYRGHITCVETNGNKFVIGSFRDDLHERTLRAHEDWLRNIFGNIRVQVQYHYIRRRP